MDMWRFLRSGSERWLLAGALAAFLGLCAVKLKFPPTEYMRAEWPVVVAFFQSEAFEDVVGSVLASLVAAYIFYVVIDVLPRMRAEEQKLEVLNRLVAAIVDSYANKQWFGHATAISQIDLQLLNYGSLDKLIWELQQDESDFFKVKLALFTAHSRLSDFTSVVAVASSLGPQHLLQWLVLVDKVRLLVDHYERDPVHIRYEPIHVFGSERSEINENSLEFLEYESSLKIYKVGLEFCVLEFLEEAKKWVWLARTGRPIDLSADASRGLF